MCYKLKFNIFKGILVKKCNFIAISIILCIVSLGFYFSGLYNILNIDIDINVVDLIYF